MSTRTAEQIDDRDFSYVVNLTTALLGKTTLDSLKVLAAGKVDGVNQAYDFYEALVGIIEPKIRPMLGETLGKIAEYGTSDGAHNYVHLPAHNCPKFLNRTGCDHINFYHMFKSSDRRDIGRLALEGMAVMVIICIARDIILQDQWKAEWDREETVYESQRQRDSDARWPI